MTGGRGVWLETALPPALGKETRGREIPATFFERREGFYGCQQKRFPQALRRNAGRKRSRHQPEPGQKVHAKGAQDTFHKRRSLTVCPYCSVGCGIIVSVRDGKVINTEGDPDNPINQGTLCPKGGSIYQMANNKNRLDKPRYRAPLCTEWQEVREWEWRPGQNR